MRLYAYTAVLTALLYPALCFAVWGSYPAAAVLGGWLGLVICCGVGLCSAVVLWAVQAVSLEAPEPYRLMLIWIAGGEIVAALSVCLIVLVIRYDEGVWISIGLNRFLMLHLPSFAATCLSYCAVGHLVGDLVPQQSAANMEKRGK